MTATAKVLRARGTPRRVTKRPANRTGISRVSSRNSSSAASAPRTDSGADPRGVPRRAAQDRRSGDRARREGPGRGVKDPLRIPRPVGRRQVAEAYAASGADHSSSVSASVPTPHLVAHRPERSPWLRRHPLGVHHAARDSAPLTPRHHPARSTLRDPQRAGACPPISVRARPWRQYLLRSSFRDRASVLYVGRGRRSRRCR